MFFTFKIFVFLALTLRINMSCVRYSTINCLNLMNKKWMGVVMIAQANDVTHSEIKLTLASWWILLLGLSEQIGVDIMDNLHRDREVIERARERVCDHPLTLYTLTSVCIFSLLFPYTFPNVLTKRIYIKIKSFLNWWSFPLFSWL